MSLTRELASDQPSIIKNALFNLLNQTTSNDVLKLDHAFKLATDKNAFLADFETTNTTPPKSDPALLERWTHYRWIRLELTYLINQKATLNHIAHLKKQIDNLDNREVPAMQDSIERAIQEDALNEVPITRSIDILKQMSLQIIGTEHPTDPLPRDTRNLLLDVARTINEPKPNEETIRNLFNRLQTIDAIPPKKRDVVEEVHRNIDIVLDKLYDNVPHLVQTILHAYKKYYGAEIYKSHENDIFSAIEGDHTSPPLLRDGAWPGFDADGNTNVTPDTMKYATRLHRIRAAEKHSAALEASVIETAKNIEIELRQTINQLNLKLFNLANDLDKTVRRDVFAAQNQASQFLIDRKFSDLLKHYESFNTYSQSLTIAEDQRTEWNNIINQQLNVIKTLVQLTQLSGTYRIEKPLQDENNPSPRNKHIQLQGDLQAFQHIFNEYINNVREDSDAIYIETQSASEFVQQHFHQLLKKHQVLFAQFPELNQQMRYFGVQLHCFGMTFGVGHVRQDSSVFIDVWNAMLDDLTTDPVFVNDAALKLLAGKTYKQLNVDERFILQKKLQDGSQDSNKLLAAIFQKYNKTRHYQQPAFIQIKTELERIDLTLKHDDLFENIIISNCESAANILEVESLLTLFPKRPGQKLPRVVPLLEKLEDLENFERILTDYVKMKAEESKRTGIKATVEIMVGFSDTERVSGPAALVEIQRLQENFIKLTNKYNVAFQIHHGSGGDLNRGSLKRRDRKATLQGNARSNVLNTATSTQWYRENQFYHTHQSLSDPYHMMELTKLPDYLKNELDAFTQAGTSSYEYLHNTQTGLGQLTNTLLDNGAYWMTFILNSSSRATQRGVTEGSGDRTAFVQMPNGKKDEALRPSIDKMRAISATQAKEMLRDNIDFVGIGHGLRKIGLENATKLYFSCATFRDIIEKSLLSEATRDLSFLAHTLFADHPNLLPANEQQENEWANECCAGMSGKLKDMDSLTQLSRLFAYLSEESRLARKFLLDLNHSVHPTASAPKMLTQPTDLLFHAPNLQAQTLNVMQEIEPLSYLFSRQSHQVARNKGLAQVYLGLNAQTVENSKLTGVGRLLANVGSGITAFRQMQPGFTENVHNDYRPNLRMGEMRADAEKHSMKFFSVKNHEIKPELDEIMQKTREKIKENSPMR